MVKLRALVPLALSALGVLAQRPSNTSICDYYTTALLQQNNATNQYTILTLLVNTAVIGNYTPALNKGVNVPGILATGQMYNGTSVNLLQYFNGQLNSTNRGGSSGVSVNFLDGGGATPLMSNMPANSQSSNQYTLLTHLYEFFGVLLGCSQVGMSGYPAYGGQASMYSVHKYMVLNPSQLGYFIEQVALSAQSFGVATADIQAAGTALNTLFNGRCGPNVTVVPAQGPALQSICTDPSCPTAANSTGCDGQPTISSPVNISSSGGGGSSMSASGGSGGSGGGGASMSGSGAGASSSARPSDANKLVVGSALGLVVIGFGALML